MKIYWNEKTKTLDIRDNGLTSLTQINFSLYLGVKILDVSNNNLTDLIGCPDSVIHLEVNDNKLTTLKDCPNSVKILCASSNNLTTLIGCPNSVIKLDVDNNNLTTLISCPNSVDKLYFNYNQLNTLEYFPNSVTNQWFNNNPLNDEWKNLSLDEIKDKSLKIKKYKEMITTSRIYGLWLLKNYEVFNIYTSSYINIPFELIKHIILFVK
jgi:hypothetical protein